MAQTSCYLCRNTGSQFVDCDWKVENVRTTQVGSVNPWCVFLSFEKRWFDQPKGKRNAQKRRFFHRMYKCSPPAEHPRPTSMGFSRTGPFHFVGSLFRWIQERNLCSKGSARSHVWKRLLQTCLNPVLGESFGRLVACEWFSLTVCQFICSVPRELLYLITSWSISTGFFWLVWQSPFRHSWNRKQFGRLFGDNFGPFSQFFGKSIKGTRDVLQKTRKKATTVPQHLITRKDFATGLKKFQIGQPRLSGCSSCWCLKQPGGVSTLLNSTRRSSPWASIWFQTRETTHCKLFLLDAGWTTLMNASSHPFSSRSSSNWTHRREKKDARPVLLKTVIITSESHAADNQIGGLQFQMSEFLLMEHSLVIRVHWSSFAVACWLHLDAC